MVDRLPSEPPRVSGFTYVRPLGTGGFADVFLFEQNMPRRQVAVKVILRDVVDPDVVRMFNAEADIMARLSAHPSILTVYDASVSADGRPYLVMEFCPSSLGRTYRTQPLGASAALHLGVKMASALETAHRSGVLHRDIKPSNILTTAYGAPVLADFGIATSLTHNSSEQLLAMSVPWSAPEIVDETSNGTVATEVWSLGATLYSLVAARSPFEAMDPAKNSRDHMKARIRRATYQRIERSDIPPAFEEIIRGSLSKWPDSRPQSMLDLALALQGVQQQLGLQPTALEVATEEWAGAGSPVDFANDKVRGPVRAQVEAPDARTRVRTASENRTTRLSSADATILGTSWGRRTLPKPIVAAISVLALVVGVGLTVIVLNMMGVI
jgi:serine/threonine protein kinase